MIEVFLERLDEVHNNGKRMDTGFKNLRHGLDFELVYRLFVYHSDEHITIGKIRSKLDYVGISS